MLPIIFKASSGLANKTPLWFPFLFVSNYELLPAIPLPSQLATVLLCSPD